LAALVGGACVTEAVVAPCPPLSEVPIVDEVGAAAELDEVRAAVDGFATWTAEPTLCLARIRIQRDLEVNGHRADGSFAHREREVRIRSGSGRVPHVTHHELCHALDAHLGDPSLDRPDLFPAEEQPDLAGANAVREAFADACAPGPAEASLADALGRCDAGGADPRWAFLLDRIFTGDWVADVAGATFEARSTPFGVGGDTALDQPFAAADGAVWLQARIGLYDKTFGRVDPETGALVALAGPPIEDRRLVDRWFGGVGDPVILLAGIGAWRATADGTRALPYPTGLAVFHHGAVVDDALYVSATADGEVTPRLFRVDLATGAVTPEPPVAPVGQLVALAASPAGLAGVWFAAGQPDQVVVQPTGQRGWTVIAPPPGLRPIAAVATGPDAVFAQLSTGDAAFDPTVVGAHTPTGWTVSGAPCGLGDGGWALVDGALTTVDADGASLVQLTLPNR
ncbi:MAG: hypothetical protein ABMB14_33780, partial [Myxococcota bacterium]